MQDRELTSGKQGGFRRISKVSSHSLHCDIKHRPRMQITKVGSLICGCNDVRISQFIIGDVHHKVLKTPFKQSPLDVQVIGSWCHNCNVAWFCRP